MLKVSLWWIVLIVMVALLAPLLANDKPILIKTENQWFAPALTGETNILITDQNGQSVSIDVTDRNALDQLQIYCLMPPVQFYPNRSDMMNSGYVSPSDVHYKKSADGTVTERKGWERHHLGTGKRGDDLFSGLIHGTRISVAAGILSMLVAGFIGILLGAAAGFFGDHSISVSRASVLTGLAGLIPAWFYAIHMRSDVLEKAISHSPALFWLQVLFSLILMGGILFLFALTGKLFRKVSWLKARVSIPLDGIISRTIEIFTSIPSLILIISLAAVSKPSLFNLIMIIGLTSWTEIARLTRAEMLRLRKLDFIASARGLAFSEWYILFRHGLPNAVSPAMVAITFGIASAILIESGLTFLGIGVPQNIATWGSLLYSGKENFNAWWLVVFPGMAIFLTVTAFNLVGEHLRDRWDPRS